ncbi:MAG: zf-HC2 domain-containing protein [Oscillospiraceae bacterium]|nr:zf-HC2 domain-containing protein [Oscillospiraceae bacterium]
MINCNECLELISAHIDGELPEPDRHALKEHLSTCESCSAIQDLYHEISNAAVESSVEAPQSLSLGVMDKVKNKMRDTASVCVKVDKSGVSPILKYLPAVACLALALLTVPWLINNFVRQHDETSVYGTTQLAAPGIVQRRVFADGEPDTADSDEQNQNRVTAAGGVPGSAPASPEAFGQTALPGAVSEHRAIQDNANPENEEAHLETEPWASRHAVPLELNELSTLGELYELIGKSYLWVELHGELPEMLSAHETQLLGDWAVWDKVVQIPKSEALELIEEIKNREGTKITKANSESNYAIVLLTRERP